MHIFLVVILLPWDTNLQTYLTGIRTFSKNFAPGSPYSLRNTMDLTIGMSLKSISPSSPPFGSQMVVDMNSLTMVKRPWVYLLRSCQKLGRASISQLRRA
ncbi:hypothetical protein C8R44DRAFT_823199 [Mycena epipterygia]|nr:hypothetical protein C8R44DRAFT_823199 [Mycena epipterygia]